MRALFDVAAIDAGVGPGEGAEIARTRSAHVSPNFSHSHAVGIARTSRTYALIREQSSSFARTTRERCARKMSRCD